MNAGDLDFILPTWYGSSSQLLSTDGAGQLSWVNAPTLSSNPEFDSVIIGQAGAYTTTLTAQTSAANLSFALPSSAGTNGQLLTTNGSGTLSWISPPAEPLVLGGKRNDRALEEVAASSVV